MRLLHNNPILYREMRARLRPGKLVALAVVLVGFLGLALTYVVLMEKAEARMWKPMDWQAIWRNFAWAVIAFQVFCAFYVALGMAANSIAREKNKNTYDFLTTLPVGPADKALGLALGTNIYPLLILVVTIPVGLVAGYLGGHALVSLVWFYGLLVVGFLTVSMVGVAVGTTMTGGIMVWIIVVILLWFDMSLFGAMEWEESLPTPLLTLSPYAVAKGLLSSPGELGDVFQPGAHHFYRWSVPWQISPLCFLGFLWVLGFALATTKLSRPSNPPLHRGLVLVALIVFQAMLLGFLADTLSDVDWPASAAMTFLVLNFLLVLAWAFLAQPTYPAVMQWLGRRPYWPARLITESLTTIHSPTIFAAVVMWMVALASILGMNQLYWRNELAILPFLATGGVLLIFLVAYLSLYTVGCAASRRHGKSLGFILVAICLAVPSVFSTLEGREMLLNLTPMAIFSEPTDLLATARWAETVTFHSSFGLAVVELVIFGGLCFAALHNLARRTPR